MNSEGVKSEVVEGEVVQSELVPSELVQREVVGRRHARRTHTERGQTTAEYALVLLAAGTIAMLVVAWAQGNGLIGGLFDAVIEKVTGLME